MILLLIEALGSLFTGDTTSLLNRTLLSITIWRRLGTSIAVGASAALTGTCIGLSLALLMNGMRIRMQQLLCALLLAGLAIPPYINAAVWRKWLGPAGYISGLLHLFFRHSIG